jgi:hypothetical protein
MKKKPASRGKLAGNLFAVVKIRVFALGAVTQAKAIFICVYYSASHNY